MFKRKEPPPETLWADTPSRLGWSLHEGMLVQTRWIDQGRRLLIRFDETGDIPFPSGLSPRQVAEDVRTGVWKFSHMAVETASGGTRVATNVNDMLQTFMLHNRHAELVLWRIANGMLYPDRDLDDTLIDVPVLKEQIDRIDLHRLRDAVGEHRVPPSKSSPGRSVSTSNMSGHSSRLS